MMTLQATERVRRSDPTTIQITRTTPTSHDFRIRAAGSTTYWIIQAMPRIATAPRPLFTDDRTTATRPPDRPWRRVSPEKSFLAKRPRKRACRVFRGFFGVFPERSATTSHRPGRKSNRPTFRDLMPRPVPPTGDHQCHTCVKTVATPRGKN